MQDQQNSHPHSILSVAHFRIVALTTMGLLCLLALSACSGATLSSVSSDSVAHASTSVAATTSYPIKVFFSKSPQSLNNNSAVFAVNRTSPTSAVATFSIAL